MNENKRTFYQTRSAHSAFETRAEENGKKSVSYTHLTLPTKLEV